MNNFVFKRIIKVCSICFVFVAFLFVLVLPFYIKESQSVTVASASSISPADSVTTNFISADFPTLISLYNSGDFDNRVMITNSDGYYPVQFNFWDSEFTISFYDPSLTGYITKSFTYSNVNDRWFNNVVNTSGISRFVFFQAYRQSSFNNNVTSVNISTTDQYRGNNLGTQFFFYDNNNNYFMIRFLFESTRYDYYHGSLSNRTYIIAEGDNSAYQQGYQNGLYDGSINGESAGYSVGYLAGKDDGESIGYQRGLDDANQYTFFNLIGSVIDAPIQVLTGLFNFNLLGVNLFEFFTGLLTLGVILRVLRMILGGD